MIMKDDTKAKEAFEPDCFNALLKGLYDIVETKNRIDANV